MSKSRISVIVTLLVLILSFVSTDLVMAVTPDGMPPVKKARPRRNRNRKPPVRDDNANNTTANTNTPAPPVESVQTSKRDKRNIIVEVVKKPFEEGKKVGRVLKNAVKGFFMTEGSKRQLAQAPPPRRSRY